MSLQIDQLSKDFPTRSGPLSVLRDINLEFERGEAVAVMGPSGSGKSTFLYVVGTLEPPTAGAVRPPGKRPPPPWLQATVPRRAPPLALFPHPAISALSSRTTTCCRSVRSWKMS